MSYDFIASKPCQTLENICKIEKDNNLNPFTKIQILTGALATNLKKKAREKYRELVFNSNPKRTEFFEKNINPHIELMKQLQIWSQCPQDFVEKLPPFSWHIHFTFKLKKPYLSQDDTSYYIIDNPVKKEWVFKVPYVASSQWKGALRSAMMQEVVFELQNDGDEQKFFKKRCQLWRIFGNEKDGSGAFLNMALARHKCGEEQYEGRANVLEIKSEEVGKEFIKILNNKKLRTENIEGFRGSLHFYPTFFDQIGLEVINPHSRKTGAGTLPIYFECVPDGADGEFSLLYVPFGDATTKDFIQDSLDDLDAISKGIESMMTRYGFGAKTSSGFGQATDALRDGSLQLAGLDAPEEDSVETLAVRPAPRLPRYLSAPGQLCPHLRASDGSLISEAEYQQKITSLGKKYSKKNKQLYVKAKGWWESEGKTLIEQAAPQSEQLEAQEPLRPPVVKRIFSDWNQLQSKVSEMTKFLKESQS